METGVGYMSSLAFREPVGPIPVTIVDLL